MIDGVAVRLNCHFLLYVSLLLVTLLHRVGRRLHRPGLAGDGLAGHDGSLVYLVVRGLGGGEGVHVSGVPGGSQRGLFAGGFPLGDRGELLLLDALLGEDGAGGEGLGLHGGGALARVLVLVVAPGPGGHTLGAQLVPASSGQAGELLHVGLARAEVGELLGGFS